MSNYIRANFCLAEAARPEQYYQLLKELEHVDCRYNFWRLGKVAGNLSMTDQTFEVKESQLEQISSLPKIWQLSKWLAAPGYIAVNMDWRVGEHPYETVLERSSFHADRIRVSFDVEDKAFLPSGSLEYWPANDAIFEQFKKILVRFITNLNPTIGAIDFEADVLCDSEKPDNSLPYWGNYLTQSALRHLSDTELMTFQETVDDYLQIDQLGVLIFIHPLAANQAWTRRHEKVRELLRRH